MSQTAYTYLDPVTREQRPRLVTMALADLDALRAEVVELRALKLAQEAKRAAEETATVAKREVKRQQQCARRALARSKKAAKNG